MAKLCVRSVEIGEDFTLRFDSCFSCRQVEALAWILDSTYAALDAYANWVGNRWPNRVRCMAKTDIVGGRKRGAGHGYTYLKQREIWLNPHMSELGLWLVFIHENLHHAFPDATENELNNVHVPEVFKIVTGKKLNMDVARAHGLGPPEPGIGDRGYAK